MFVGSFGSCFQGMSSMLAWKCAKSFCEHIYSAPQTPIAGVEVAGRPSIPKNPTAPRARSAYTASLSRLPNTPPENKFYSYGLAWSTCVCITSTFAGDDAATVELDAAPSVADDDALQPTMHLLFLTFLQILPTAAFPFSFSGFHYMDFPDCLLLLLSISVSFLFSFFSVFTFFQLSVPCGRLS